MTLGAREKLAYEGTRPPWVIVLSLLWILICRTHMSVTNIGEDEKLKETKGKS
jgi:hypothetical protein